MSINQWVFEYISLKRKEERDTDTQIKILQAVLVSTLGLNAIRPVDSSGAPKEFEVMTDEERNAFLPLVAWVGKPDLLKTVKDQMEFKSNPNNVSIDEDEYERLVEEIDKNNGDMEPILGLPDLPHTQHIQPANSIVDVNYGDTISKLVKQYPEDDTDEESIVTMDGV